MKLIVDVSRVSFMVSREVAPRMDQTANVQRRDKVTGLPMWTVQLVAMDEGGAEVIQVTVVAPEAPKLSVGSPVVPVCLEAIPWAQNGKNGTAFRAQQVKPVTGKSVQAVS